MCHCTCACGKPMSVHVGDGVRAPMCGPVPAFEFKQMKERKKNTGSHMSLIGLFKALLFCFEGLPVLVRDLTSHAPQHAFF